MIWFAIRTQRLQFLAAAVVLILFAGWLVLTGTHDHSAWLALVNHGCERDFQTPHSPPPSCNLLNTRFTGTSQWTDTNAVILYAIPGLLGLLFGAPLVAREIEHGTNRLAWSQSITRTRWLAYKLAVATVMTLVLLILLSPMVNWWFVAARTGLEIERKTFDLAGIVPIAYGLFALMLGAALGALIRRTSWSIAAGVGLFVGARLAVHQIRDHLAPLRYATVNTLHNFPSMLSRVWQINSGYVPDGRVTPSPGQSWNDGSSRFFDCLQRLQPANSTSQAQYVHATDRCLASTRLHYVVEYQPANHFWPLQLAEGAIFVGAALLLLGATVWAVRKWRT